MSLAKKAQSAVEDLVEVSQWYEDRYRVLSLVLEHLIQGCEDRQAQKELRSRIEKLEGLYGKRVRELPDRDAVVAVDLSPGLLDR